MTKSEMRKCGSGEQRPRLHSNLRNSYYYSILLQSSSVTFLPLPINCCIRWKPLCHQQKRTLIRSPLILVGPTAGEHQSGLDSCSLSSSLSKFFSSPTMPPLPSGLISFRPSHPFVLALSTFVCNGQSRLSGLYSHVAPHVVFAHGDGGVCRDLLNKNRSKPARSADDYDANDSFPEVPSKRLLSKFSYLTDAAHCLPRSHSMVPGVSR
jgi:hypothetical protein